MHQKKRFIITAGGTGGHIFPAVAIAKELLKRDCELLFVGNKNSIEQRIAFEMDIPYAEIDVQKLYRTLTAKHLLFPFKLLKSLLASGSIIKRFKPDACIGTGGFVSAPVLLRAALSNTAIYLQEQNSVPGLTTKLLSPFSTKIFSGFPTTMLPQRKTFFTGNPLREEIIKQATSAQIKKDKLTLLILGGSQGAQVINNTILQLLPELFTEDRANIENILWQCGDRNFEQIKNSLDSIVWHTKNKPVISCMRTLENRADLNSNQDSPAVILFSFCNIIPELLARTDIAVSRAGAISLAELEVMKIPAIIIPIPKSAGNHQFLNAKSYVDSGQGVLIEQHNLNPQSLLSKLNEMTKNLNRRGKHRKLDVTISKHLNATKEIVEHILSDKHRKQT